MAPDPCPCGTGEAFADCCGPLLAQHRDAATAEQLMRSRYTAFVRRDADYLVHSWHPETCPRRIRLDPDDEWLGLTVVATDRGGALDADGSVQFVAQVRRRGAVTDVSERSRFTRIGTRWVYRDGVPDVTG